MAIRKLPALFLALAAAVFALPAAAGDPAATPGIDRRLSNQERRIENGRESGALTPREAQRMDRRAERTEAHLERAQADNVVSAQERRRLQHELDQDSRSIAHQKHDLQHDHDHDGKRDRPRR